MGAKNRNEKRFDLSCPGVKVHCRTDRDAVQALELELQGTRHVFGGDRIESRNSEVGILHTVTLNARPHLPWVGFSLLLPHVGNDLGSNVDRVRVRTLAIRTRGPTNPDPDDPDPPVIPLTGVAQSYEFLELVGTVSDPGAAELPETADYQQWSAVRTVEAQFPDVLAVEGILVFPRTGYAVDLQAADQQNRRSEDLRLQLTVNRPTEPTAEVPTTVIARYQTQPDTPYKTVTILSDGPTIPVETTVFCGSPSAEQKGQQLKVEATLSLPEGDYEVGLRRAVPQGKNPKDLWLQLTVREPIPPPTKRLKQIEVRYEETSDVFYEKVIILPNRISIAVSDDIFIPLPENPGPASSGDG